MVRDCRARFCCDQSFTSTSASTEAEAETEAETEAAEAVEAAAAEVGKPVEVTESAAAEVSEAAEKVSGAVEVAKVSEEPATAKAAEQAAEETAAEQAEGDCSETCVDVPPPSTWETPTCEGQLSKGLCEKRVQLADGWCEATCGICVPCGAPATWQDEAAEAVADKVG